MEDTGFFALAAHNTDREVRGDTYLSCAPLVERKALEEIFVGDVAAIMTQRKLSFGVVKSCELAMAFDRGHVPIRERDDQEFVTDDCDCPPATQALGKQIDGGPAPAIPIRKLGHLSQAEAEQLLVPQIELSPEQRARANDGVDFDCDKVRVRTFLGSKVPVHLELGQMQQYVLKATGISDPNFAYPVQIRYYGRNGDKDKVIGEFVVLFVRKHDPFSKVAQIR